MLFFKKKYLFREKRIKKENNKYGPGGKKRKKKEERKIILFERGKKYFTSSPCEFCVCSFSTARARIAVTAECFSWPPVESH